MAGLGHSFGIPYLPFFFVLLFYRVFKLYYDILEMCIMAILKNNYAFTIENDLRNCP